MYIVITYSRATSGIETSPNTLPAKLLRFLVTESLANVTMTLLGVDLMQGGIACSKL